MPLTYARTIRTRRRLRAVSNRPRLTVFRSNLHIWAQLIDDQTGKTLASANSKTILSRASSSNKEKTKATKLERAHTVGLAIAEAALKQGIKQAVFDRGPYRFHGRVKALAEAAKSQGLII